MPNSNIPFLLKSDILRAQEVCKSAAHCARYLGCSYTTYKKYAQLYGVFENLKNPHGWGISKGLGNRKQYRRELVIKGMYPNIRLSTLRNYLIDEILLEERCALCGYNEKRITDQTTALLLDFIDGDKSHRKIENLRLLCYNCYYHNVGDVISQNTSKG